MKLFSYLSFVVFCFLVLYAITLISPASNVTLSDDALYPDLLLSNAKEYAEDHAYTRSLMHLDMAIQAIKNIEQEIEPENRKTIDLAINQLNRVYEEIRNDTLRIEDMEEAFIKALNALSFAEIKVSEHYIASNQLDKARVALKYGRVHIKNALRYSLDDKRDYEIHLYAEIDSIINNDALSDEEIIMRLERMLSELDTLVTD